MTTQEKLAALKVPFAPSEIDWRIGQSGKGRDGKWWATCLAYITGRAVQDRLDDVFGGENWRPEYREWSIGTPGVLCGLSIRIDGEWITKWDGADQPDTEPMKGGLSNALKRAAVPWGIGRYLYDLPKTWADIRDDGLIRSELTHKEHGKVVDRTWVKWNPPPLPSWAIPEGSPAPYVTVATTAPDPAVEEVVKALSVKPPKPNGQPPKAAAKVATGKMVCPKCGGDVWDNRPKKASGEYKSTAPDGKCKNKDCGGSVWPPKDQNAVTPMAAAHNVAAGGPGMPGGFDEPPDLGPDQGDELAF